MSTIFISHSSNDNNAAEDLGQRLARQYHHSIFLDVDPEKGIVAGRSWEHTLYRKLRSCRAMLAICTDDYLSSKWCFAELALARMEGKHIAAILVDGLSRDAKLPAILSEKQFNDLRSDTEGGYERLWRTLSDLDLLGLSGEWNPENPPYLWLSAYQEEHAPVFFGREDEIRAGGELLERGAPGLIMVLGASGSGKSSMVRAGIVPRLRRDQARWLVVGPFRPGRDPFAELSQSLVESFRRYAPDVCSATSNQQRIRASLEQGKLHLPKDTLYTWRSKHRKADSAAPGQAPTPGELSSEEKFAVVLESASLNEVELSEYSWRKGLYPQQINAWRNACLQANAAPAQKVDRTQLKAQAKHIKQLQAELRRKEKALAETAALLVLEKKSRRSGRTCARGLPVTPWCCTRTTARP